MADSLDVGFAIRDAIVAAIYPTGMVGDVPQVPVKVYPGWPLAADLEEDLRPGAGVPLARHISIFATPSERNVTRHEDRTYDQPRPVKTYAVAVAGLTATVTGQAPEPYRPQNLALFVNGRAYLHQATAGQTPALIAAALHALVAVDHPGATVLGAVITLPSTARVGPGRVGVIGATLEEVRRVEKVFDVIAWAESGPACSELVKLFDAKLSRYRYLDLPDGSRARIVYQGSRDDPTAERQRVYKRHLSYRTEFATTIADEAPEIVVFQTAYETEAGDPIITVED